MEDSHPAALVWVMVIATVRAFRNEGYNTWVVLLCVALVLGAALLIVLAGTYRSRRRTAASVTAAGNMPFDAMSGGFPVPPLPGQTLPTRKLPGQKVPPPRRTDVSDTSEDSHA